MNVLFISNLYPNPYHQHRAPWNRQQLAAVSKRHAVHVISPLAWTDEIRWRRAQGNLLPADRQIQLGDIAVDHPRYYFTPRVGRGWYGAYYRRSIQQNFRAAMETFQPDVVLAAWAYPDGWAAIQLAKRHRVPCVLKVHGSDVLLLDDFPARRAKTLEALQSATGVISVSQDLKRVMTELGVPGESITVVYDGVGTEHFFPGSRQAARQHLALPAKIPQILFVGNLVPVKGVDRLIRACGKLERQGETFHLHLVGSGPLQGAIQSLVQQHNLGKHVTLHGAKPHVELPDWFRAADVFCLPSHSEGVPNVLLESAACGTPFVAFDVGGIKEIADWGPSTLVPEQAPEQSVDSLAASLQGYLQSEKNAPAPREFRSFDDSATELEQVLRHAIGGGSCA